jgi:hypothetical protein
MIHKTNFTCNKCNTTVKVDDMNQPVIHMGKKFCGSTCANAYEDQQNRAKEEKEKEQARTKYYDALRRGM